MATINTWNNTVPSAVTTFNTGLTVSAAGIMTNSKQPAFFAYCNTDPGVISSLVTVHMDTEVFDRGSNYNPATFTFTAPVTGVYMFGYYLYISYPNISGGTSNFTNYFINAAGTQYNVVLNGSSNGIYPATRSDNAGFQVGGTLVVSLAATNTVFCQTNFDATGGSEFSGIITGQTNTYFWGYLIA